MEEGHLQTDSRATALLSVFLATQGDASAAVELRKQCQDSWNSEYERLFANGLEDAKDDQEESDWAAGWFGSRVIVDGLKSSVGQQLNGRFGTVVSYDSTRNRFGVDIDDIGLKSLKLENVVIENAPHIVAEFFSKRAASQADEEDNSSVGGAEALRSNAQVSQALLTKPVEEPEEFVVLLKFERNPKKFLDVLMSWEVLAPYREDLESHGLAVILPSRAKIFVHPFRYQAVLQAIEEKGLDLYADHVIIEPDIEHDVVDILKRIVKPKQGGRETIALEFGQDSRTEETKEQPAQTGEDEKQSHEAKGLSSSPVSVTSPVLDLLVVRTFIHFSLPSSVYTPSSKTQARTA